VIELEGLDFSYGGNGFRLRVPEFTVAQGEQVALIGPSGCGKTTLLHLVAGILGTGAGRVRVGDTEVSALGDAARRDFRAARIGLVFQEFELLDYLDVVDNILLPYRIARALRPDREAKERAQALAESVGIGDKLRRFPAHLSQGERQRVAVCRALVTRPLLVLADEPTGNLDPANKERVLDLLLARAKESGATLLAVMHDHSLLGRFGRVVDATGWA
jgi:putative ABC transport system ATP-binding protein